MRDTICHNILQLSMPSDPSSYGILAQRIMSINGNQLVRHGDNKSLIYQYYSNQVVGIW